MGEAVSLESEDDGDVYVVQVSSAGYNGGDFAKITVNNVPIFMEKNESQHYRGLHIVLIDSNTGSIKLAKVFDTYKSSKAFDNFITSTPIPEGYIIAAACKDDCISNLSDEAIQWFADMGSK